jgi:hypothetical protein
LTAQSFATPFKATKEQVEEAEQLIKGLTFTRTYSCNDGYESWEVTGKNMDAFVELINRARTASQ